MAQGGLKKLPYKFLPPKSKSSRKSKPLGPKKRGQYIAPKKPKSVQAHKLKKQLQQCINHNIEEEVTQRAKQAGTEFRLLSTSDPTPSSSSSATKPEVRGNNKQKSSTN